MRVPACAWVEVVGLGGWVNVFMGWADYRETVKFAGLQDHQLGVGGVRSW